MGSGQHENHIYKGVRQMTAIPANKPDRREAFEKHFMNKWRVDTKPLRGGNNYFSDAWEGAWQAWQHQQSRIEMLENKLRVEEKLRIENLKEPAVGHNYWERYFKAKYEVDIESLQAQLTIAIKALEKYQHVMYDTGYKNIATEAIDQINKLSGKG
jgi:hypothetical protein